MRRPGRTRARQQQMKQPLISVVVVNWNGVNLIGDCLQSLRSQTFKDYEVIVADNGSNDGSLDLVAEQFPEVRLISLGRNHGFCGANNRALDHAQGEFVALLNNDAAADVRWLETLHYGIASSQEVGLCASKIVHFDHRNLIDSAGDGFGICGVGFKRGHSLAANLFEREEEVFGACGAGALYRRSLLDEVGFFDEDLFCVHEDVDLSFRARLLGYKCLFIPQALVYHKGGSTLGHLSDDYVYYGQRNAEIVCLKNMPGPLLFRYFHHHLLYNLLALGYFVWKGKGTAFLKAKRDFLRMIPSTLKKRRDIQAGAPLDTGVIRSLLERKWLSSRVRGKW
jgi:GT2 family glycosyltransferase